MYGGGVVVILDDWSWEERDNWSWVYILFLP